MSLINENNYRLNFYNASIQIIFFNFLAKRVNTNNKVIITFLYKYFLILSFNISITKISLNINKSLFSNIKLW